LTRFVTQKLMWAHEFTVFPHKLFWWEAPDGSRLLTYFPHDYAMGIDPVQLGKDVSVWMPSLYGTKPPANAEMMHLYGVGDHGRRADANDAGYGDTVDESRMWCFPTCS